MKRGESFRSKTKQKQIYMIERRICVEPNVKYRNRCKENFRMRNITFRIRRPNNQGT